MRTTTYIVPISSIHPHSPSITTASSSRKGCVKAICTPAMRFDRVSFIAIPTTRRGEPRRGKQAHADMLDLRERHQHDG